MSCCKFPMLLLLLALPLFGQSNPNDPLDLMYLPSIDLNSAHYPGNVWVTSALAKVHQDGATTPGNVKWALPYAAKNEFEGFQVHERAGANTITLDRMIISDLVNAQTGTHITATGSPASITVYREGYYNVQTLSDANGTLGYTPDVLIPVVDHYRGQTTNAFPVTIAANQTQSVWFDIFVPPTAPSGYYKGTVTITNNGSTYTILPVVLAVWNFTLPSTSTLTSHYGTESACMGYYGSYSGCVNYPGARGSGDAGVALSDIDVAVMMLDHRVTAGQVVYPAPSSPPNNWTTFDSRYGPLLNGKPANTSTILSGAAMTEIIYMSGTNIAVNHANLQDWMSHFISNGWQSKLLAWAVDEPSTCSGWTTINTDGSVYHGTTPPYIVMTTSDIADATTCSGLSNIDILIPTVEDMDPKFGSLVGQNQRSTYNSWLAGKPSRQLWMYEACQSHGGCSNGIVGDATMTWPSVMVDSTPVRNRIMQWIEYLNDVSGDLYYDVNYCWVRTCGDGNGNAGSDPWKYIYYSGGNGDGTLIYPGTSAKIGVTVPIPLPSIRLKNIRDGMEDYEYLHALTNAGFGSFAMAEAQSVITNAYTFNNDPTALLNVRTALGNKLHKFSLTTAAQPPTGLTAVVQ